MPQNRIAQVVIGAQFGDEGKGRMTAAYAAAVGRDGMVVRFNGGAQAGHTVVTAEGRRHVFSHVGSGTFAGAATFLSRFFVSHPLLFLKEWEALAAQGVKPTVYVDPASPVTTPYDMMLNQIVEQERGANRHGSCGVGFGETLERHLTPDYALTVGDLADAAVLTTRLEAIRRCYAPARLARLGFGAAAAQQKSLFLSDAILEHFVADGRRFLDSVTVIDAKAALSGRRLLFEGAQGLLLDQERGCFPHVTRSHTGLRNVLTLADEWGLERLEVTYVTRAYLTRHGAGPLPHELPDKPYPGVNDPTNLPNAYQGSLRFAWLDLDLLQRAIAADRADATRSPTLAVHPRLAITCLDQIGAEKMRYYRGGKCHQATIESSVATVAEVVDLHEVQLGFGA
jgi:adenylosuccinate synthase